MHPAVMAMRQKIFIASTRTLYHNIDAKYFHTYRTFSLFFFRNTKQPNRSGACPSRRVADSVSGCGNRLTNAMGANTTPCRISPNEQFHLLRPIWWHGTFGGSNVLFFFTQEYVAMMCLQIQKIKPTSKQINSVFHIPS